MSYKKENELRKKILSHASHRAVSERYSRSLLIKSCSVLRKLQASLSLVGFFKERKLHLILLKMDLCIGLLVQM